MTEIIPVPLKCDVALFYVRCLLCGLRLFPDHCDQRLHRSDVVIDKREQTIACFVDGDGERQAQVSGMQQLPPGQLGFGIAREQQLRVGKLGKHAL